MICQVEQELVSSVVSHWGGMTMHIFWEILILLRFYMFLNSISKIRCIAYNIQTQYSAIHSKTCIYMQSPIWYKTCANLNISSSVRTEKLIKCINLPQHKIKHSEPILKLVNNAISIELELTPSLYCVVLKYEFKIKYAHNYMLAYTKVGFSYSINMISCFIF
jgi:hypothetical protein